MIRNWIGSCLVLAAATGLCGCVRSATPQLAQENRQPEGNLVLYVSNQSFDKPKVDISITIDGNRIIADTFRVKDQHCWEEYSLNLPAGSHRLKAQVDDGAYELETEFDTEGKHWAVVSFWFKEGKKGKTSYPPRITFEISDTPVMFL